MFKLKVTLSDLVMTGLDFKVNKVTLFVKQQQIKVPLFLDSIIIRKNERATFMNTF